MPAPLTSSLCPTALGAAALAGGFIAHSSPSALTTPREKAGEGTDTKSALLVELPYSRGGKDVLAMTKIGDFLVGIWTPWWVKLCAAVLFLILVTGLFHYLLRGRGAEGATRFQRGLWPLIIGKDGRVSTSKLQVALWSYAVVFGLLMLLFNGKEFGEFEWQPEYLLLLGSPAAAALLAKAFTTTKVESGTIEKPETQDPALRDVVSDDEGRTDLFDFQYFLINLVVLLYFFVQLFRTVYDPDLLQDPKIFLPPLPLSLVALTSLSAASYSAKKGLEAAVPALTGAYPSAAAPMDTIKVQGRNLVATGQAAPQVTFGGRVGTITSAPANAGAIDEVQVSVPVDAEPGSAPVRFTMADGAVTEPLQFEVVAGGPKITAVQPRRIVLDGEPKEVTIVGLGFGDTDDPQHPSNGVTLDDRPLDIRQNGWTSERVRVEIPPVQEARQQGFTVPGEYGLMVQDRHGRRSQAETVHLDELVPVLTGVYPGVAAPGEQVRLLGRNLTLEGGGGPGRVEILFGRRRGEDPQEIGVDEFEVTVPADIDTGSAPVKYVRADGAFTQELPFEVVSGGP